MVPKRGLEPLRPYGHQHLKLARLPIPPPGQGESSICFCFILGASGRTRTCDPRLRRAVLYPAELLTQCYLRPVSSVSDT